MRWRLAAIRGKHNQDGLMDSEGRKENIRQEESRNAAIIGRTDVGETEQL